MLRCDVCNGEYVDFVIVVERQGVPVIGGLVCDDCAHNRMGRVMVAITSDSVKWQVIESCPGCVPENDPEVFDNYGSAEERAMELEQEIEAMKLWRVVEIKCQLVAPLGQGDNDAHR